MHKAARIIGWLTASVIKTIIGIVLLLTMALITYFLYSLLRQEHQACEHARAVANHFDAEGLMKVRHRTGEPLKACDLDNRPLWDF